MLIVVSRKVSFIPSRCSNVTKNLVPGSTDHFSLQITRNVHKCIYNWRQVEDTLLEAINSRCLILYHISYASCDNPMISSTPTLQLCCVVLFLLPRLSKDMELRKRPYELRPRKLGQNKRKKTPSNLKKNSSWYFCHWVKKKNERDLSVKKIPGNPTWKFYCEKSLKL